MNKTDNTFVSMLMSYDEFVQDVENSKLISFSDISFFYFRNIQVLYFIIYLLLPSINIVVYQSFIHGGLVGHF